MTATPIDTHAVNELILWGDNTEWLYRRHGEYIKNVQRRLANGSYDHSRAPLLWRYWIDQVARSYCAEFCCSMRTVFPVRVRMAAAVEVADREYTAILAGEYDTL